MGEVDLVLAADFKILWIKVKVVEIILGQVGEIERGIGIPLAFECLDLGFQFVNFSDGALEGEAERIDGAFESFQEIDLHHADEDSLAAFLIEVSDFRRVFRKNLRSEILLQLEAGVVKAEL